LRRPSNCGALPGPGAFRSMSWTGGDAGWDVRYTSHHISIYIYIYGIYIYTFILHILSSIIYIYTLKYICTYIYVYIQLHITIHNHIQLYIYIYSKNTTASKRDMSFIENRDRNFMGIIPTYFQTHPYIY
jgi:hypothetical protein